MTSLRTVTGLIGIAVALLLVGATPAVADPSLDIELNRDTEVLQEVHRSDERVDYSVTVSNAANTVPGVGDELTCDGAPPAKEWGTVQSITFEWRRNGAVIPAETSVTYTTVAADAGTVIQCLVKGENLTGGSKGGNKFASLHGIVIDPPPAVIPPRATDPIATASRPAVSGSGVAVRTCSTASMNWVEDADGNPGTPPTSLPPASFTFQWLRNGAAIPGATSTTYTPTVATGSGTRSSLATGTGARTSGSNEIQNLVTTTGTFSVGESISGSGIPAGTTIAAIDTGLGKLTLSASATSGNGTSTALVSGSKTITGFTTTTGTFAVGDRLSGTGLVSGTEVLAIGAGTLTLDIGVTAAGTSTITGGIDNARNFQCQVIGSNAGGSLVGISNRSGVNEPSGVPNLTANQTPAVALNRTGGPVTVELELPAGLGVYIERFHTNNGTQTPVNPVNGWACTEHAPTGSQPAKAVCTRSDPLNAGASYPAFWVAVALSADMPDLAVATATVSGGGTASPASAVTEFTFAAAKVFGIEAFETIVSNETAVPYKQAGGHPFSAAAVFSFNKYRELTPSSPNNNKFFPIGHLKTVVTDTPRGFVGNALALVELCASAETVLAENCPPASVVGGIDLRLGGGGVGNISELPIYAIEPEFGRPAQFAFTEPNSKGVYVFFPKLRPEDGYAITLESAPVPASFPKLLGVKATICGFGAATRVIIPDILKFDGCKERTDPTANPKPVVTVPTRCAGPPPTTRLAIDSWNAPGEFVSATSSDPRLEGCELVKFEPEMVLEPTSHEADSPTGMDVEVFMPTEGLLSKNGISQANLKRVTVTLPDGMAVNASAGHGLGACTAAQVGMDSDTGVPNDQEAACPDSSKIGTIGITTPLIQEKLTGDVFIAKQGADNPFDSNIALYMVFSSKKDGITIKVAGEVKPDPATGRMTIVFDDNPEAPFSTVELHFPQGPRSPLLNPPRCGTYEIKAELTPWSASDPDNPTANETVEEISTYEVTSGPNGGPCPDGRLDPKLNAGTTAPIAGQTSPFTMRLSRDDGTQRFTGLELAPPQGLTAYLKGVDYCPDAVLASISPAAETGQAQIDNPSCPASSQIGTASAGAGAGPDPLFVDTGKVYLAGPYKGAPLSLAVVTPAVAGPLDLGNVVIRTALRINSKTAQITAVSDPVPTILHGILLDIRDIRVAIDRPNFTLNPTNCEEMAVGAKVTGDGGGIANVSNRFQVADCGSLGFKPRMSLSLKGGTKRGDNPALKAVVRPRPGDANIGRAAVTLPRSAFLDQAHIRTVCTRVQFAADNCPKGAIYGRATAVTPLLDEPLKGNVYLRSSDNKLPDLVADLRGPAHQPIKVEAAFRTDSIRGGIRSTLDFAPDAPVTKFTLQLQGGKKGLVINSRDLCANPSRADARLVGQNGRRYEFRPKVTATNCAKQRKGKRKKN